MNGLCKGFDPEYLKGEQRLKSGRPVRMFQKFRRNILRTWARFLLKGKEKTWKHFQKQLIGFNDWLVTKRRGKGSFKYVFKVP